jgi:hypothetical protein
MGGATRKVRRELAAKSGGRIFIRPPLNFSDYFFFAAFFLAFFFAAIIVSFKVNLGIVHVQFAVRTPNARFFSNDLRLYCVALRKKLAKTSRGESILCHS